MAANTVPRSPHQLTGRERHDDAIRPPVTALVGFPLFLLFLQEIISGSRWFPAEILGCGRQEQR